MFSAHNIAADFQQQAAISHGNYSLGQILKRAWHTAPDLVPDMDT